MPERLDQFYRDHPEYYGQFPTKAVVEIARRLPPGSHVLDVGAGQGRNTFALAANGHQVYALDESAEGLGQIKYQADKLGMSQIHVKEASIKQFPLPADVFDAVCFVNMLHFLRPEERKGTIEKCQRATKAQGYHVILVASEAPQVWLDKVGAHLWTEMELQSFYKDWRIEACRQVPTETFCTLEGARLPMKSIVFVAQKP